MNLFRGRVQRLEEKVRIPGRIHVITVCVHEKDTEEKALSRYKKNHPISLEDDLIFVRKFSTGEEAVPGSPSKESKG